MSKNTSTDGFGWDELWAGFGGQPDFIKKHWIKELKPVLKRFMDNSSKKIQDEVFEAAPDIIKKYFGYNVEVKQEQFRYQGLTPAMQEAFQKMMA